MPSQESIQNLINMAPEDYMKNRVQDQINWLEGKSKDNKNYYLRFKFFVILFSVSIPFLVSFIKDYPAFVFIVGAVGVLIAAFEGILSLFDFQNNWLNYRNTAETLKREQFLFATKTGAYKGMEDSFLVFVERAEAILDSENKNWSKYSSDAAVVPQAKMKNK